MRRRVVVTGLGVVASIGKDSQAVLDALRTGRSGISFSEVYAEMGFRSQVHGDIKLDLEEKLGRRLRRFMGDGADYAHVALSEAVADAGLAAHEVSNERTGLIMGAGGPSSSNLVTAADIARERGGKAGRPLYGATLHGEFGVRQSGLRLWDSGGEPLDQFRVRHQRALYRQWFRTDPDGQSGHRLCRRLRGAPLDPGRVVRWHGGATQRMAVQRPARGERA